MKPIPGSANGLTRHPESERVFSRLCRKTPAIGARLALNFVVNYEDGGERSVLHGDRVAETRLTDLLMGGASTQRPERKDERTCYL